ncbi:hypothetical protein N5923_17700 [Erwiniaceae bacterium BAC15a-03b]|uniref:Uncharacterized protein n=1 Tax=Winslowiella arboricola TaxID=2978220 RepID=A0A9J6PPG7_9GAMM|nr:hypothetical protein [Winslowiella arboricola]MCU5775828.1 hypothetical protein [Winslowiella arboricola]MCU5779322.1 hypothetical protein [Winslowiella arboricola]
MKKIIVPVSTDAMSRLDLERTIEGDLIEAILDSESFDEMCHRGIFERLNGALDINIDDYEDERITEAANLRVAREIISLEAEGLGEDNNIVQLLTMVDKAIEYDTGVFFFF